MGGVPLPDKPDADQAELKLEQLVDQRDMAVSMEGLTAEADTQRHSEILALADVRLPPGPGGMPLTHLSPGRSLGRQCCG